MRSSGWEFDPAVADCGLQGTANSPSSTTVIVPSLYSEMPVTPVHVVPGLPSGAERNRTADLQIAILALSQLSYCPENTCGTKGPKDRRPLRSGSGFPRYSTERVGFEPTVHMVNTRSPGVPIQPLSHLSQVLVLELLQTEVLAVKFKPYHEGPLCLPYPECRILRWYQRHLSALQP